MADFQLLALIDSILIWPSTRVAFFDISICAPVTTQTMSTMVAELELYQGRVHLLPMA